jgi:DNA-binding transcriptional regulator YiaG
MNVRQLRRRLGLTGEELAHHVGVSSTTVSRWENKKFKPSKLARMRLQELAEMSSLPKNK